MIPGDANTNIAQLRQVLAAFVAERQWERFHDAKNLAMSIAIEAAELMEHFQWTRSEELPRLLADGAPRAEIEAELADVFAYTLALANVLDIDLTAAFTEKMRRNAAKYPAAEFRGHYHKPRPKA